MRLSVLVEFDVLYNGGTKEEWIECADTQFPLCVMAAFYASGGSQGFAMYVRERGIVDCRK